MNRYERLKQLLGLGDEARAFRANGSLLSTIPVDTAARGRHHGGAGENQ